MLFLSFVDYPCPPLRILLCPSLTVCRACITGGRAFADVINKFSPINKSLPVSIAMQVPLLTKAACKSPGSHDTAAFSYTTPIKTLAIFLVLLFERGFCRENYTLKFAYLRARNQFIFMLSIAVNEVLETMTRIVAEVELIFFVFV